MNGAKDTIDSMTFAAQFDLDAGPFSRQLAHAVEVIDLLHRCPRISRVPITMNRSHREDGAYLSAAQKPVGIRISLYATHPALTLVHEIGHLLDHVALNPIKRGFGSEHDPAFEKLWDLWRNSSVVLQLERILRRTRLSKASKAFIRYKLQRTEMWARSYVQWVAFRSGDQMLAAQLDVDRVEHLRYPEVGCEMYWEDAELNPIMDAVDELFQQMGLL